MGESKTGVLHIEDCSRGLNDWYPPRLDNDQLAEAWDVEFWDGAVCGRRNGSITRVGAGAGLIGYSLYVWTPTTSRADDRLALLFRSAGVDNVNLYDATYTPATKTFLYGSVADGSQGVDWASLHGKLFIAVKSNVNRLHVYDPATGDNIRPTGLGAPVTGPIVTPNAGGGFTGVRNYRARWAYVAGGVTLRRSEPGPVTIYTPTGGQVSVNVAQPAPILPAEGQNLCEIEELAPNGSWYRMGYGPVWVDTLPLSAIASTGILSEDVGDYTLQYSARWLTVDEDRLLLGGSFDEQSKSARVSWTPIGAGNGQGQIGSGNDERLPSDVDGFLDFDTLDGGGLTGLKAWEGKVIAFKRNQVHQLIRSSSRLRAYLPDTISRRHGAIPFSVVEGTDVNGLSCLYFLDPEVGPMQLGFQGLRVLAPQMQRTWKALVNLSATVICNVTYHAEKRQVWWQLSTGANTIPNVRWMYSVESDGLVFHTLPHATRSATTFTTIGYNSPKPHMCYETVAGWASLITSHDEPSAWMDVQTSLTERVGYRAYVVTKAYQLGQLLRRFQVDSALIEVATRTGAVVNIICRRDYGLERRTVPVLCNNPTGPAVDLIVVPVDNSYMVEAITMQFEIGDFLPLTISDVGAWQVHGLTLAWSLGSPSTGRG